MSELRAGLRHGFFEYRLRGEIVAGRKRQLTLEAGQSYKFTIAESALAALYRLDQSSVTSATTAGNRRG